MSAGGIAHEEGARHVDMEQLCELFCDIVDGTVHILYLCGERRDFRFAVLHGCNGESPFRKFRQCGDAVVHFLPIPCAAGEKDNQRHGFAVWPMRAVRDDELHFPLRFAVGGVGNIGDVQVFEGIEGDGAGLAHEEDVSFPAIGSRPFGATICE